MTDNVERMSRGERKIYELLKEFEVPFETEVEFESLRSGRGNPLRIDFVIYNSYSENRQVVAAIEVQGEQHYQQKFQTKEQFARQKANDNRKRGYFSAKNIKFIEIPFDAINGMTAAQLIELIEN